jgi:putative membrane protein
VIIRGGTGFKTAFRMFVTRNWLAVLVVLGIESGAWWLHELVPELDSTVFSAGAVGVLATIVGIFVAFRFNEAYGRWWEARILWGGMVNVSRTFARQVTTLLTPDRVQNLGTREEARALHRELVYRHLAYVNALRLSLRRQAVLPEATASLDPEEAENLRSARNVPTQLTQRQAARLTALLGRDTTEQILLRHVDESLTQMTELQGGMERIKQTAFPDAVITVTRVLVWMVGILIAVAFIEPDAGVRWFEFVAVMVIVLSFLLVKQLGEDLNDPFENQPNDTPMTALCRTIEIDLRQQLGETDLPPSLEPVDGVLM